MDANTINNKKVAVIYYGFLRSFNYSNHLENLIIPNNCDVFIRCPDTIWARPEHDIYWTDKSLERITKLSLENIYGKYLKSAEIFKYNPKSFQYMAKSIPDNFLGQPSWRILSLLHNMNLSCELKTKFEEDNNFKYDLCILTRTDLTLHNVFNIDVINPNNITYNIGEGKDADGVRKMGAAEVFNFNRQFNDQIIVSSSDNINLMCDLFNHCFDYALNDGVIFNSETLFGYHCIKNNIIFEPKDMIDYTLDR